MWEGQIVVKPELLINLIVTRLLSELGVAKDEGEALPDAIEQAVERSRRSRALEALTGRQREVLSLMAEGRTNRAIARRLSVTEKTVEAHISIIYSVLGLEPVADDHRRVLAVVRYMRS
jgi:DNA-binding NarL/FixJ family response regulator